MRKKVEDQLGVGAGFDEADLKHDVLLEKVRTICEEKPEELSSLIQALMDEETGEGDIVKQMAKAAGRG